MAVAQQHLLVQDALPAVVITLNRPEQRNALSTPLMRELTEALERESARPEVRAIVLRASGPAFSAGHDLKELIDRSLDEEREIFDVCTRMMQTIQRVAQPVIAARSWPNSVLPDPANPPTSTRDVSPVARAGRAAAASRTRASKAERLG